MEDVTWKIAEKCLNNILEEPHIETIKQPITITRENMIKYLLAGQKVLDRWAGLYGGVEKDVD